MQFNRQIENYFKIKKYGYFLIWGNGLLYQKQILGMIRNQDFLKILKIQDYKPKSIAKFVRIIYSYDYAPFAHLKAKTKYLLKTIPAVRFIFFQNNEPLEAVFGEEFYSHIECRRIKQLKEIIRDKFNPKINGQRTEEHVIHASDNEIQTDLILKYLGVDNGLEIFKNNPNSIVNAPYYVSKFSNFKIKLIDLSNIYCHILIGRAQSFHVKKVMIQETPHFACLCGKPSIYDKYLEIFFGQALQSDYSVDKFMSLAKNFNYLGAPNTDSYIITKEFEQNKFVILDGVHRACIMKFNNIRNAPMAVI